jgi:hypothetical protein
LAKIHALIKLFRSVYGQTQRTCAFLARKFYFYHAGEDWLSSHYLTE